MYNRFIGTCRLMGLTVLATGLLGGCGGEFVHNKTVFPKQISPYYVWGISNQPRGAFSNLRSAIDGNNLTLATSQKNYQGAAVTIDFGRSCIFNSISILHGENEFGFAQKIAVSTSLDGKKYILRRTFPGTRKVTYLLLRTPVRGRFLRLKAVTRGSKPWSIAEIYVQ